MNYGVLDVLTLIGSLGLFLFGMKKMSDSLQHVAGDGMRRILGKMTSNRIKGVFTGFFVTTAIQSSSATTVMVVSFVNAGLLSLLGAIGVIMGANIGTTVTAWIVSLLGFKISINVFVLPLIAFSFPFLFSKKDKLHAWGELIIGFSILFIGLDFLKKSVPDIHSNPEIFEFLSNYSNMGFWSVLIFMGIGTMLTVVIQSSSATMALTLVMCSYGWISYENAAAMVLGENIGTTITANLAAIVANVSAKRAARAHFIFNVIGVIWMLFVFKYFLMAIDEIFIKGNNRISVFADITTLDEVQKTKLNENLPIALSIFHTSFNIVNTALLIGFAPLIEKLTIKMVRSRKKEKFRLKHIGAGYYSTGEIELVQAKKEIERYAQRSKTMFGYVKQLINETDDDRFDILSEKIEKYEKIGDNMEIEISDYLAKIFEDELSLHASARVRAMLKIIDNIESIFDACHNISRSLKRKKQSNIWFTQEIRDSLNKMTALIDLALDEMIKNLEGEYDQIYIDRAYEIEKKINDMRDKLKDYNTQAIKDKKYKVNAGVVFTEIFSYCETMGDHIINVNEAIETVKKQL
ncbi:MAG: Na/Pi cotransporter family protein [Marinilabiliales bacterium]